MTSSLTELNNADRDEAYANLVACCGSTKWAARLLEHRPFADLNSLEQTADRLSQELTADDWLEAFASHPRIGKRDSHPDSQMDSTRTSEWSAQEQAGTRAATDATLSALAAANLAYEERFGYIFIVCATGRTSEEMLAICQDRLNNDAVSEMETAAIELRKIARIRLRKLVGATD